MLGLLRPPAQVERRSQPPALGRAGNTVVPKVIVPTLGQDVAGDAPEQLGKVLVDPGGASVVGDGEGDVCQAG